MTAPLVEVGAERRALEHLRVLVVDDDQTTREVVRTALAELRVREAVLSEGVEAAIGVLATKSFDVILCDLNIIGIDGVACLERLHSAGYRGGVGVISAADPRLREAIKRLAHAFPFLFLDTLPKPVSKEGIEVLLRQGRGPAVASRGAPSIVATPHHLELALASGQVCGHYQPKVELATDRVVGLEALARWLHPEHGLVHPGVFVPLAEEHGLTDLLTTAIARNAIAQAGAWRRAGTELSVAINISGDNLADGSLPHRLVQLVEEAGCKPSQITIELTETRLVSEQGRSLATLVRLSLAGFRLSIDDFGTGFSNFTQLRQVPWNELKIDQSFVRGALTDPTAAAILSSSIDLARRLEIRSVVEGVETQAELDLCRALGADLAQGYFLARPMPAHEVLPWLSQRGVEVSPRGSAGRRTGASG